MPLFGRWLGSGLAKVALRAIDRLKVGWLAAAARRPACRLRPPGRPQLRSCTAWPGCRPPLLPSCTAAAARRRRRGCAERPTAPLPGPCPSPSARQRKEDLTSDEEYAVERLCSWLARVHGADPLLDEALDDAQREFLLSYRLPAPEADTPGGGRRSIARTAPRQYILPARSGARTPRGSCGSAADLVAPGGEPSRHSSEEGEALLGANDPEVQQMLRAVSVPAAWLLQWVLLPGTHMPCCRQRPAVCRRYVPPLTAFTRLLHLHQPAVACNAPSPVHRPSAGRGLGGV